MDEYLDEQEYRKVCKIHGYVSSGGDSSDIETPAAIYERYKPDPIEIDPKKHTIIEVGDLKGASNMTYSEALKKNAKIEPQGNCKKLSKGQKRRRKKKQKKVGQIVAPLDNVAEEKQNQRQEGFPELNAVKAETSGLLKKEFVDEKSKNQKQGLSGQKNKLRKKQKDKPNSGIVDDCQNKIEKSEHQKKPELVATPVSDDVTFRIIEELNIQLNYYIAHNTCNGFGILTQTQLYLQSLTKLGIALLNCILCVATIIKELALLYENYIRFMTVRLVVAADIQQFFFVTETIIYETVTQGNYNSDFHFMQVPVQKYIYESLSTILDVYLKIIVATIYKITGVDCLSYIAPWTRFRNNGVLHLGHLADFIQQKRSTVPVVELPIQSQPIITELTSSEEHIPVDPVEKLEEIQTQSHQSVTEELMCSRTKFIIINLKQIDPTSNLTPSSSQRTDDLYESRSSLKSLNNESPVEYLHQKPSPGSPTQSLPPLSIQNENQIQSHITDDSPTNENNNLYHLGAKCESRTNLEDGHLCRCKKERFCQWLKSVFCCVSQEMHCGH